MQQLAEAPVDPHAAADAIPTLQELLAKNDKLVPTLSLFTALTIFSRGVEPAVLGSTLSFLCLIATALLFSELRSRFPPQLAFLAVGKRLAFMRRDLWNRLSLFAVVLDLLFIVLFIYSFLQFRIYSAIAAVTIVSALIASRIPPALRWITAHARRLPVVTSLFGGVIRRSMILNKLAHLLFVILPPLAFLCLQKLGLDITATFKSSAPSQKSIDVIRIVSVFVAAIPIIWDTADRLSKWNRDRHETTRGQSTRKSRLHR